MSKKLEEILKGIDNTPMSERVEEIEDRKYRVISHYIGEMDLDKTIEKLALEKAYREIDDNYS